MLIPAYITYSSQKTKSENDRELTSCLGGAVVGRRTRDRKVASWLPAGVLSSQLGQLSLPSLWGR